MYSRDPNVPMFYVSKALLLIFTVAPLLSAPESHATTQTVAGGNQAEKIALGRLLFFDKILSGNRDISCATCHHPMTGSSDGLSLPVGTGAAGLSVSRSATPTDGVRERVPRNSPALFNLGEPEFMKLFHDGRLQRDPGQLSGFHSPAGDQLPRGLDNIVAAQAMFPVQSAAEMAGQNGENPVADAAAAGDLFGPDGVWPLLTRRITAIPEYVDLFAKAYEHVNTASDISFVHIANSIAAFEIDAFQAQNSPFDRYLRGQYGAMSETAKLGAKLFYGDAGCSDCHAGKLQTDHQFHSIGIPPIGQGKGDGPSGRDDFGLERVSGRRQDRYRFRTPSLRNVALTGPWGHSGAYNSLQAVILHHLQPEQELNQYNERQSVLPDIGIDTNDFTLLKDTDVLFDLIQSIDIKPIHLTAQKQAFLIDFLLALTDPTSIDQRRLVPTSVPSGLKVSD